MSVLGFRLHIPIIGFLASLSIGDKLYIASSTVRNYVVFKISRLHGTSQYMFVHSATLPESAVSKKFFIQEFKTRDQINEFIDSLKTEQLCHLEDSKLILSNIYQVTECCDEFFELDTFGQTQFPSGSENARTFFYPLESFKKSKIFNSIPKDIFMFEKGMFEHITTMRDEDLSTYGPIFQDFPVFVGKKPFYFTYILPEKCVYLSKH